MSWSAYILFGLGGIFLRLDDFGAWWGCFMAPMTCFCIGFLNDYLHWFCRGLGKKRVTEFVCYMVSRWVKGRFLLSFSGHRLLIGVIYRF